MLGVEVGTCGQPQPRSDTPITDTASATIATKRKSTMGFGPPRGWKASYARRREGVGSTAPVARVVVKPDADFNRPFRR